MITFHEVDFRKNRLPMKVGGEIHERADGIAVVGGLVVEAPVVATDSPSSIRLGGDKEW